MKIECKHGHAMTPENCYLVSDARRCAVYFVCRTCKLGQTSRSRKRAEPRSLPSDTGGRMHASTALKLEEYDWFSGQGFGLDEIAAKLGTTEGALEMLLHRHRGIPRRLGRTNR